MSKSLGNGIDPIDVIEKYGADSLRWLLSNGSAPGQDVRFSYEKMDAAWNFINKIWNASRFVIMNIEGMSVFAAAAVGASLGFLRYNAHPARVFMGDTGSLALGGAVAMMAIFSRAVFLLPMMGICFVASAISVILQVGSYKLRKKRIFKMAPLHHHFELKGVPETKVVAVYMIVTAAACLVGLLAYV